MSKHTKGPWRFEKETMSGNHETVIFRDTDYAPDKVAIAKLNPFLIHEREANAALIASAPEMLEAMKRALPWIGKLIADGGHLNSVAPNDAVGAMEQLSAAIARAEGRE